MRFASDVAPEVKDSDPFAAFNVPVEFVLKTVGFDASGAGFVILGIIDPKLIVTAHRLVPDLIGDGR
jgi:hypothetical protein